MTPTTEKVILHFDFSHLPADTELTFIDGSKPVLMKVHTPATRLQHKQTNKLLAAMSDEHLNKISHFVEQAEFSTTEVSTSIITYPSKRAGAVAGAIAAIYTHKPRAEVQRVVQSALLQGTSHTRLSGRIRQYDIDGVQADAALLQAHHGELLADAGYTVNYKDTALKLVMQHPDIATMAPGSYVRIEDVIWDDPNFNKFARYIKEHNDDDDDHCWYRNTVARDVDGNILHPCDTLTDKDGNLIVFPKMLVDGKEVSVLPHYDLSDGVCKAMGPLLGSVLETVRDLPSLKGENWSALNGSTTHARTGDDTRMLKSDIQAANAANQWTVTASTSQYGIDFYTDSVNFDAAKKLLSFEVKQWANRWLGVYCEFLDADGNGIEKPDNWINQSSGLGNYDKDKTKRFLDTMGPGCIIFGFPVAALTLSHTLTFPVPDNAASVKIRFCGMGQGEVPGDLCELGMTYTLLISYGLPCLLMMLSVGMQSTKKYIEFFEKRENVLMVLGVAAVAFAPIVVEGGKKVGKPAMLAKAGELAVSLLLSAALKKIAMFITKEVAYQQFLQNQPAAGWMLKVLSCTAAIAGIASTVHTIGQAPASINFDAKRSMTVGVTVRPDPSHGTSTQAPIWPETGIKYKILVRYEGSIKTLSKEARLPEKNDAPIEVSFCAATGDALAIIPNKKFQVVCTIYTKNDAIVGQWSSDWSLLLPEANGKLQKEGAIMERLVPLASDTRYEYKKKLAYNTAAKKYEWDGKSGGAPKTTASNLSRQEVSELTGITINNLAYKLGYTYRAGKQNLPLDYNTHRQNEPMYVMKSISVLNNPAAGMKVSGFGMSVQPSLAYDQFGPMGLFVLDPATDFHKALNDKSISPALRDLFSTNNIVLPVAPIIKVVVKDTSWTITYPGESNPRYALRRQVDIIKVFQWPTPEFSPKNFFLDTRTFATKSRYHLRLVDLQDSGNAEFGADSTKSWGTFGFKLDEMAIHPAGHAVGINYEAHKMAILKLADTGLDDDKAEEAMEFGGPGWREGLLRGPVAMTITADGRILILESQNARIQAFDIAGNPVPCFAANLKFSIDSAFAENFKKKIFTIGFWQALQKEIPVFNATDKNHLQRYLNTSKINLASKFAAELDRQTLSAALRDEFSIRSMTLSENAQVQVTKSGQLWIIESDGVIYDARLNTESQGEIAVYLGMAATVVEQASGAHWLFNDNHNGLAFDIRKNQAGKLEFRQMVSFMALKPAENIRYLDLACEMKGYIYVLSCKKPGDKVSDYALDIYLPDGTPLTPVGNNGQPVAARLTVDQWRNMFTLNYEQLEGAGGRPEPSISLWIPNA